MDVHRQGKRGYLLLSAVVILVSLTAGFVILNRAPHDLSGSEQQCVGAWAFIDPDRPGTLIVYDFGHDRRVRERHFYLTSATPMAPRITASGQWRVESDGQLVVEPSDGMAGIAHEASETIGEAISDDQDWVRPVLRQFYWLMSATPDSLKFRVSRDAGRGQVEIVMKPFLDVAAAAQARTGKLQPQK